MSWPPSISWKGRLFAWKRGAGFDDLAQSHVQRLHHVGGVNRTPNLLRITEQGYDPGPVCPPQLADRGVLGIPALLEFRQALLRFVHGSGAIDRPQILRDPLA